MPDVKPWDVIGWAIIAIVAGAVGVVVCAAIVTRCVALVLWMRSRRTPPVAGQVWVQDGMDLVIDRVTDDGRVVIRSGMASWSDGPAEWAERVRSRHIWNRRTP